MLIQSINSKAFSEYGKIITQFDIQRLLEVGRTLPVPEKENLYQASCKNLEEISVVKQIQNYIFGGLEIEVGFCNGHNSKLNAMEYHKSIEVCIAVTDLILIYGKYTDIENEMFWNSALAEAFYIPSGTVIEQFPLVLHFSPCRTNEEPFRSLIILPKGTNTALEPDTETINKTGEERLLFANNKWLIAHPDREVLIKKNAFPGIRGENIYLDPKFI